MTEVINLFKNLHLSLANMIDVTLWSALDIAETVACKEHSSSVNTDTTSECVDLLAKGEKKKKKKKNQKK